MKIWKKHHVSEDEVFEVFENLEAPVQIRRIGKAYLAYGRTFAGRYLVIALYERARGEVFVATARDMTNAERKLYTKGAR